MLRGQDETAKLPILMLTGDISQEARQEALSRGAKDFLSKPFHTHEVLLRIATLLETRFLYLQIQGQNQLLEAKVRERTRELEAARRLLTQLPWRLGERRTRRWERQGGTSVDLRRVLRRTRGEILDLPLRRTCNRPRSVSAPIPRESTPSTTVTCSAAG